MLQHQNKKQQGVALIFVMLIFTIITAVAVRLTLDVKQNTESQADFLYYQQAKHYAMGGEQYALALLSHEKNPITTWHQPWSDTYNIEVQGGNIIIEMIDEQSRINLNWLHKKENKKEIDTIKRLFTMLNINPDYVDRISAWEKEDPQTTTQEDAVYLALSPPIRSGAGPLVSVSELKLMQLFTKEQYEALLPLVTVLPNENTLPNINTMPPDLFSTIFSNLTPEDAEEIVQSRGDKGFKDIRDMQSHPALEGKKINWKGIKADFKSRYFSVYIKAQFHDSVYYLRSLVALEQEGRAVVLSREQGQYPHWVSLFRQSMRSD